MTRPQLRAVGVVVPAHDEAAHIGDTLRSVLGALEALDTALRRRSAVVVVADACHDRTAQIARATLRDRGVVVEVEARCVGTARALGSTTSLDLLDEPPDRIWLANTDADSVVPTTWLERQLALAESGVECVAGIVGLAGGSGHLREAFGSRYSAGIGPAVHSHVHGANLGMRGDLLERLGNWSSRATGEDRDLWDRAGRAGAVRRTDAGLVVLTSARTLGRAPAGFARDLRRLAVDLTTSVASPGGDDRRQVVIPGTR